MLSLEACNVLSLEAFGTFRYFKFYGLTFVQGLVAVHLNRGEVDKNIFPGLPLDETVTLRSIKPLHCPLFLHFHYLELECFASPGPRLRETPKSHVLVSRAPATAFRRKKKAAKFVLAAT
jgi:hypothetical protein